MQNVWENIGNFTTKISEKKSAFFCKNTRKTWEILIKDVGKNRVQGAAELVGIFLLTKFPSLKNIFPKISHRLFRILFKKFSAKKIPSFYNVPLFLKSKIKN